MSTNNSIQHKEPLPNATGVLILGILSILLNCGVFGLVLGIIGLVISKEGKYAYLEDPDKYSGYGNLNAGRIMCIIGIVIGGVSVLMLLFWIAVGGAMLGMLSEGLSL